MRRKGNNYNEGRHALPSFVFVLILALFLAVGLCGCGSDEPAAPAVSEGAADPSPAPAAPPVLEDEVDTVEPDPESVEMEEPKTPVQNVPAATAPAEEVSFDFTWAVPESAPVTNAWFDDAVFVGDSRTEGFALYSGLPNAKVLTSRGLKVDTAFTKEAIKVGEEKLTVMAALEQIEFSKVYLMLGINEMGWVYPHKFIEGYEQIIDHIRTINPEAQIYVQSLIPVTKTKHDEGGDINNERITMYNELIREMAQKKEVYYVYLASALADESGCLPEEAAFDGVHLKKAWCEKWLAYLKSHTVGGEAFADPNAPAEPVEPVPPTPAPEPAPAPSPAPSPAPDPSPAPAPGPSPAPDPMPVIPAPAPEPAPVEPILPEQEIPAEDPPEPAETISPEEVPYPPLEAPEE